MTTLQSLTEIERGSVNAQRAKWSNVLAEKLRKWCEFNGYIPRSKLADELGIPRDKWKHIIVGPGIGNDVAIYACLYLRTGLTEADPRMVPPRVRYAARKGHYYADRRAWADQEYENWKKDYQPPPPLTGSSKKTAKSTVPPAPKEMAQEVLPSNGTGREPEAEPQTLGAFLDRFLAIQEERIASRVVEALRQEREDGGDIGKQLDRVFHSLVKYLDGTPEDRDRLMAQYGKTHISRVFSLLRDLSSEDRETVLQLNQHRRK